MPRQKSPARLWLRPAKVDRASIWCIVDDGRRTSTGCIAGQKAEAEATLEAYIMAKRKLITFPQHGPDQTLVADVLSVYHHEVVNAHRPASVENRLDQDGGAQYRNTEKRIDRLKQWWGAKTLADVTKANCEAYVKSHELEATDASKPTLGKVRSKARAGVKRDLEDLRSAIHHHARRKLHTGIVQVILPIKSKPQMRYLTRNEVARLLWICFRHRREQVPPRGPHKGQRVGGRTFYDLRHLARFIMLGIYTGSHTASLLRASICTAADRPYIDLEAGLYFRPPEDIEEAGNKCSRVCRLPPQILWHLRRWKAIGMLEQFIVEWRGQPVSSIKTAWARAVVLAEIDGYPPPHSLRPTCITWLKQRGISSFDVGQFVGMSEHTVENIYGHHDPNFRRRAAAATEHY